MLYNQGVSLFRLNSDISDIRVQFTNILCYILLMFGLIGNILGLCIFCSSRRSCRISSVYVYLATSSSIINLFCVIRYALILHSKSEYMLSELVGHSWLACKIYEFSFGFRVISSWITLFWMFERLTCVSKRFRSFFCRCNTSKLKLIFPCMIMILILVCVLGPPLYMFQPQISPRNDLMNSTTNLINRYCGVNSKASAKWHKYFSDLHLGLNHYTIRCLFSELIPAGMIILFNSYIIYHLIETSHHFNKINDDKTYKERKRTTSWMNVVLIIHSSLFLLSLLSHIAGHFMSVEAHETWWVLLAILGNCSLNFYVYCLSSKAFRQQILRFIQQLTTHKFYKIQIRQEQWKQHQHNSEDNGLIYKYNHRTNIDQPRIYRFKNYQRSIRMNSLFRISEEESTI